MSLSSQNKKKDTKTRKNKIKREGFVKIYLTLSFRFSIKLPLNSQNSSPEWVYGVGRGCLANRGVEIGVRGVVEMWQIGVSW